VSFWDEGLRPLFVTTAQYAVTVRFDGGCQGNSGRKYGSYRIEDEVVVMAQESRFELGHGTFARFHIRTGVDLSTRASA
jgi:hypothetical protein